MIEFRTLETFVWVAQLKSFRGAAARLNTTQPSVSQRIAQLEEQLGARLIERGRSSFALTEAGRSVLVQAERLLRLRAELVASVTDRSQLRGTLRLGAAETIVHTWLPRFVEAMSARYDRVTLEIEVDISPNLRERLLSQEIDLAFMLGPISEPSILSRPLRDEPTGFFASPRLGFPAGQNPLARIAAFPIITFARNTQPYMRLRELLSDPHLPPTRLHASAALATAVRMALDGLGVALIPASIVADDVAAGRLVEVGCAQRIPDLQFVAGWLASPDVSIIELALEIAAEAAAAG
ncbi:MAG TPA: LysR family transcriptional regulator [Bosea sp. (in: a-proteobacteria)]|uniref:LysR family transcriptional regulator n=1 Tax=Bosea sp. (in: a-proteobacteria) TaxID=1871050 RepID=UPI002E1382EF|nr:LysR family transcriptional regulator [Bosea sp. (in: a-proteobacteria)]